MNEKTKLIIEKDTTLKVPKVKKNIAKSCSNCMDYIVCWGEGKFNNDPDEDENKEAAETAYQNRAEKCTDWHLDFMTYQELIETEE